MATAHGHFVFTATGNAAQETGAPDTGDTPHSNSPAAVQTLDTLALLALLHLALGSRFTDDLAGALGVGGSRADAFLMDDVPHRAYNAAVGARGGDDGFHIGGID